MHATYSDIIATWEARLASCRDLRARVDGVRLCELALADFAALQSGQAETSVTLREAQAIGGYSRDHLQRLVATGEIENIGRKGRPRLRRSDVPVKPGHSLRSDADHDQLDARRRIVASARDTHPRRA